MTLFALSVIFMKYYKKYLANKAGLVPLPVAHPVWEESKPVHSLLVRDGRL